MDDRVAVFALEASAAFGERVAQDLGIALSEHEERDFEDGEHKVRPLVSVRGKDVYVIQSLYGEPGQSPNDKLCRLLFFIGALRDAGADRVTAVVPYLCYSRKERRTKKRDPITTRYVASLFEAVGVDNVMSIDVHSQAAFENAFRCTVEHLEGAELFVEHFASLAEQGPFAVVSPDVGGVKRAEMVRQALSERLDEPVASAFMEKRRSEGVVSGHMLIGEVRDRTAIIIDDMVATGTTLVRAAQGCSRQGAKRVYAAATHGLFVGGSPELLAETTIDQIVVTDTVPPFRVDAQVAADRIVTLEASAVFAEAIRRMHEGESVTELIPR